MPTIRTPTAKTAPLNTAEAEAIIKQPVVAQAVNYNVTAAHNREVHELANGVAATLPTVSGSLTETDDFFITFKAMGASATINPNSQNVDGAGANITLGQYETVTLVMNAGKTAFHKASVDLSVRPIAQGGTEASTAAGARTNLGIDDACLQTSKTFIFSVSKTGVGTGLPSGWSVAKGGSGLYEITHNLGHTNYSATASIDTGATLGTIAALTASVYGKGTTLFNVATNAGGGTLADEGFSVIVYDRS